MSLSDAAARLGIEGPETGQFEGVSCDSRRVEAGMLFAALPGERADGHNFVRQAAAAGAAALLVSRPVAVDLPQLVVDDVLQALGRLAQAWRERSQARVVAITGSNGKTTTKEMLAGILRKDAEVLATAGNYNNELGLPLTLFGLEQRHGFAVLELGASKAGDIRYLAGIAQPEVGVVTNVGPAHLQGFGDEEGVARAKGELFASLPPHGVAVINADEPWAVLWQGLSTAGSQLTFGVRSQADVQAVAADGGYRVSAPGAEFLLRLHLPGEHNLMNALAATAAASALGVDSRQIQAGLEATLPVPGRLNLVHTKTGWTVIDDTYNANPASLYAALQVLTREAGEPWLVLGDMKELGPASRKLHAEMGEAAAALGVRRLFTIGEAAEATVAAFGAGGSHFEDHDALIAAILAELRPGIACLVKGSRSMAMDKVVRAISDAPELREAG